MIVKTYCDGTGLSHLAFIILCDRNCHTTILQMKILRLTERSTQLAQGQLASAWNDKVE